MSPVVFRNFAQQHAFLKIEGRTENDIVKRVQQRLRKVMEEAKLHKKTKLGMNIHTYVISQPPRTSKRQ